MPIRRGNVEEKIPNTEFQRCIVHKIRNLLIKVRSSDTSTLSDDFKKVFELENQE